MCIKCSKGLIFMENFDWTKYVTDFTKIAENNNKSKEYIEKNLKYSKNLYDKKLPIIYDVKHLSKLIGIQETYFYQASNSQESYYRKFKIYRKDGRTRTIHEPLPNLKTIQKWILENILYQVDVSRFAKAYIKETSIKDNVRFHINQKKILKLDIKNFFPSIKGAQIYKVFLELGYTAELTKMFTDLSLIYNRLPQGAPTSAYLSNLSLLNFDIIVSSYCTSKKIRYTRYADDMTFSGDFNVGELIELVKKELAKNNLFLNERKTRVLRKNTRQLVTGITVNEKLQVSRPYRKKIRLEMYYIQKHGITSHLKRIKYEGLGSDYTKSLLGKIKYCLYINPKDSEMEKYKEYLDEQRNILFNI